MNTRWSTGSVEPGSVWAERPVILNPGGSRIALQAIVPPAIVPPACAGGGVSLRNHWKPSVETSVLKAESGMREGSVRLANTICSITCPWVSHSWVLSGMAVESSIHSR